MCSQDVTCQAGGDTNKRCSGGSCVCKTGYRLHIDDLCVIGKKKNNGLYSLGLEAEIKANRYQDETDLSA